jgi:hypothetical protein
MTIIYEHVRRVTHAVDAERMRELLERAPRACIGFVHDGRAELVPVELRLRAGRYWIGVSPVGSDPVPGPDQPLKLLVDEGMYYFDMRGIWIRGRASFGAAPPEGGAPNLRWFQLVPEKCVAWDFGAMREREG